MKLRKKVLASLLSVAMVATVFAGCGTETQTTEEAQSTNETGTSSEKAEETSEVVNLHMYVNSNITPDLDKVGDAISEITKEKIGATITLHEFGPGEYTEKMPMLIASDEPMDIGFDAGWMTYVQNSKAKAYLDIKDMLDTVPALKEFVPEELWEAATVDGGIYGVPNYKEIGEAWVAKIDKTVVDEMGFDLSGIKKLEDFEPMLEYVQKNMPERALLMVANNPGHLNVDAAYYFDTILAGDHPIAVVDKEEGKTVQSFFETERYQEFIKLMRDWYLKGYICEDALTRDNFDEYTKASHNMGIEFSQYAPQAEASYSAYYGSEVSIAYASPVTITNNSATGSMCCIYAKSEHPEEALKFLELLNTDTEIKDLLTYGIEGVHYTLNEDGKIVKTPEQYEMYDAQNWATGSIFTATLLEGESDTKYEEYQAFNDMAVPAVNLGFQPETDSIADKIAAVNNVVAEYNPVLAFGTVEPDEVYPQFVEALKAAGIDDIISELQRQFDEWQATK